MDCLRTSYEDFFNDLPIDQSSLVDRKEADASLGIMQQRPGIEYEEQQQMVMENYSRSLPCNVNSGNTSGLCADKLRCHIISVKWPKIVQRFAQSFDQVFSTSKKAHFDCVPPEFKVVDGARSKWRNLLLMDAVIHFSTSNEFTFVSRRAFNQQKVLFESIMAEVHNNCGKDALLPEPRGIIVFVEKLRAPWDRLQSLNQYFSQDPPAKSKKKYLATIDLLCGNEGILFDNLEDVFANVVKRAVQVQDIYRQQHIQLASPSATSLPAGAEIAINDGINIEDDGFLSQTANHKGLNAKRDSDAISALAPNGPGNGAGLRSSLLGPSYQRGQRNPWSPRLVVAANSVESSMKMEDEEEMSSFVDDASQQASLIFAADGRSKGGLKKTKKVSRVAKRKVSSLMQSPESKELKRLCHGCDRSSSSRRRGYDAPTGGGAGTADPPDRHSGSISPTLFDDTERDFLFRSSTWSSLSSVADFGPKTGCIRSAVTVDFLDSGANLCPDLERIMSSGSMDSCELLFEDMFDLQTF